VTGDRSSGGKSAQGGYRKLWILEIVGAKAVQTDDDYGRALGLGLGLGGHTGGDGQKGSPPE
jgi:hypothetical protein